MLRHKCESAFQQRLSLGGLSPVEGQFRRFHEYAHVRRSFDFQSGKQLGRPVEFAELAVAMGDSERDFGRSVGIRSKLFVER